MPAAELGARTSLDSSAARLRVAVTPSCVAVCAFLRVCRASGRGCRSRCVRAARLPRARLCSGGLCLCHGLLVRARVSAARPRTRTFVPCSGMAPRRLPPPLGRGTVMGLAASCRAGPPRVVPVPVAVPCPRARAAPPDQGCPHPLPSAVMQAAPVPALPLGHAAPLAARTPLARGLPEGAQVFDLCLRPGVFGASGKSAGGCGPPHAPVGFAATVVVGPVRRMNQSLTYGIRLRCSRALVRSP